MNKKIKKVFKSLDPDVQEAIKFLINKIQVKREIKKLEKSEKISISSSPTFVGFFVYKRDTYIVG